MKVVTMEEETDANGYLHLTIPSDMKSVKTEVVVIIQPKTRSEKKYDFSDLVGKLQWQGDPLEIQKKMRDEWP